MIEGSGSRSGFTTLVFPGDNVTEMRVKFLKKIEDTVPAGDD
jgi:hypothetical protein